jgi:transcriptional regulator with XRE-family HTH domain
MLNHEEMRRLREDKGWTQSQAAELAGMTQPMWARMETGERPDPKVSTVERIAQALGVSVNNLLK